MKYPVKICVPLIVACLLSLTGCGGGPESTGAGQAPVVFVSILPQAGLLEALVPEGVAVETLVGPGQSPETYNVMPRQMEALGRATLFFRVGIPFENSLVDRLSDSAPNLTIIDLSEGLDRIEMIAHHHDHDHADHDHDHDHDHGELDPHVWLDPLNAVAMAEKSAEALIAQYPDQADAITANRDILVARLRETNETIAAELSPCEGKTLYVFHPAYGYFAERYGLKQVSIEFEGKEPGTKRLQELAEEIGAVDNPVLFVQPQFSDRAAKTLAQHTGATIHTLDPLAKDYEANLMNMAETIRDALCPANDETTANP